MLALLVFMIKLIRRNSVKTGRKEGSEGGEEGGRKEGKKDHKAMELLSWTSSHGVLEKSMEFGSI